jgi:hypothetical protein
MASRRLTTTRRLARLRRSPARAAFLQRCFYKHGQFNENAGVASLMQGMEEQEAARLVERASSSGAVAEREQVRMYYMAVPPFLYASICGCLRAYTGPEGMAGASVGATGVRTVERFVLEKPFGRDVESCAQLNRELSMLREDETYRIDHCERATPRCAAANAAPPRHRCSAVRATAEAARLRAAAQRTQQRGVCSSAARRGIPTAWGATRAAAACTPVSVRPLVRGHGKVRGQRALVCGCARPQTSGRSL